MSQSFGFCRGFSTVQSIHDRKTIYSANTKLLQVAIYLFKTRVFSTKSLSTSAFSLVLFTNFISYCLCKRTQSVNELNIIIEVAWKSILEAVWFDWTKFNPVVLFHVRDLIEKLIKHKDTLQTHIFFFLRFAYYTKST